MQDIYNELITKIDSKQIKLNEPMKNHTTFKVRRSSRFFYKNK